jgi:hypothetical protein
MLTNLATEQWEVLMPIYSEDDEDFWENSPPSRVHNQENAERIGLQLNVFPLGEPDDPATPLASLLYIPPHHVLPRHSHPCYRVEVMIRGTLNIGDRVLHSGDVSVSGPDELYGPHIAGEEGSLSVEIFSRADGMDSLENVAGEVLDRLT